MTKEEALAAADKLGYPVLLRPSYVIGGQNMTIAFTESDISRYMDVILAQHIENPVLCDKYLMGQELEVDAISDGVGRAHPRHHAAYRARGRAQRRLHRRLPAV